MAKNSDWEEVPLDSNNDWEEVPLESPKKDVSMLESAYRSLGKGFSGGFSDRIGGALGAGYDKVAGLFGDSPTEINEKLASQGFKGDIGPTDFSGAYNQSREEQIADDEAAYKANPKISMLANLAGSTLMPGGNIAKGTSALKAAGIAARSGAIQAAGYTPDLTSIKALEDIASGAALSGLTGSAFQGLSNKFSKIDPNDLSSSLKSEAEIQSAKAQGLERGTRNKLNKGIDVIEEKKVRDIGRQGLDKGIVKFRSSSKDMAMRNQDIMDEAMSGRQDIYDLIDSKGVSDFYPRIAAENIDNKIGGAIDRSMETMEPKASMYDKLMRDIKNKQGTQENAYYDLAGSKEIPTSINEAQNLTEKIGNVANFDSTRSGMANDISKDVYNNLRSELNDSVERSSEKLNIPGMVDRVKSSNKIYSTGLDADKLIRNKIAREANQTFGLRDVIALSGQNPLIALPLKAYQEYGSKTAAIGLDKIGDVVKNNPQAFGKFANVLNQAASRGKNALGAAHFILQSQNPEYREQIKNLKDGEEE